MAKSSISEARERLPLLITDGLKSCIPGIFRQYHIVRLSYESKQVCVSAAITSLLT